MLTNFKTSSWPVVSSMTAILIAIMSQHQMKIQTVTKSLQWLPDSSDILINISSGFMLTDDETQSQTAVCGCMFNKQTALHTHWGLWEVVVMYSRLKCKRYISCFRLSVNTLVKIKKSEVTLDLCNRFIRERCVRRFILRCCSETQQTGSHHTTHTHTHSFPSVKLTRGNHTFALTWMVSRSEEEQQHGHCWNVCCHVQTLLERFTSRDRCSHTHLMDDNTGERTWVFFGPYPRLWYRSRSGSRSTRGWVCCAASWFVVCWPERQIEYGWTDSSSLRCHFYWDAARFL